MARKIFVVMSALFGLGMFITFLASNDRAPSLFMTGAMFVVCLLVGAAWGLGMYGLLWLLGRLEGNDLLTASRGKRVPSQRRFVVASMFFGTLPLLVPFWLSFDLTYASLASGTGSAIAMLRVRSTAMRSWAFFARFVGGLLLGVAAAALTYRYVSPGLEVPDHAWLVFFGCALSFSVSGVLSVRACR